MNNPTLTEMEELISYINDDRELMELGGEYGKDLRAKRINILMERKDFEQGIIVGHDL